MIASITKAEVTKLSTTVKTFYFSEFGSFKGLSIASIMLFAMINKSITYSKLGSVTVFLQNLRISLSNEKKNNEALFYLFSSLAFIISAIFWSFSDIVSSLLLILHILNILFQIMTNFDFLAFFFLAYFTVFYWTLIASKFLMMKERNRFKRMNCPTTKSVTK